MCRKSAKELELWSTAVRKYLKRENLCNKRALFYWLQGRLSCFPPLRAVKPLGFLDPFI